MSKTKYISVPVDLANKIESLQGDDALMSRAIDEYFQWSVNGIVEELSALDETIVQYRGLNAKARQQFREVAIDVSEKAYKVWEDWDEEMPKVTGKIDAMRAELAPLKSDLDEINTAIKKISMWDVGRMLKTMQEVASADNETKKILAFLMKEYYEGQ